jgi:hypothetical protein
VSLFQQEHFTAQRAPTEQVLSFRFHLLYHLLEFSDGHHHKHTTKLSRQLAVTLLRKVLYAFSLEEPSFPTLDQNPKTGNCRSPSYLVKKLRSNLSLYLDIWVPPNATSTSKLPVKVWIYGGGEQGGGIQNPLFDGCNLAAHDTLLVSISYRLGSLGYLTLDSAGIAGNFGTEDLILGLEWVQSNIAAFGGDPVRFFSPFPDRFSRMTLTIPNRKKFCCSENPPELRMSSSLAPCQKPHPSSTLPPGNQELVHNSLLQRLLTLSEQPTPPSSTAPQM